METKILIPKYQGCNSFMIIDLSWMTWIHCISHSIFYKIFIIWLIMWLLLFMFYDVLILMCKTQLIRDLNEILF